MTVFGWQTCQGHKYMLFGQLGAPHTYLENRGMAGVTWQSSMMVYITVSKHILDIRLKRRNFVSSQIVKRGYYTCLCFEIFVETYCFFIVYSKCEMYGRPMRTLFSCQDKFPRFYTLQWTVIRESQ